LFVSISIPQDFSTIIGAMFLDTPASVSFSISSTASPVKFSIVSSGIGSLICGGKFVCGWIS